MRDQEQSNPPVEALVLAQVFQQSPLGDGQGEGRVARGGPTGRGSLVAAWSPKQDAELRLPVRAPRVTRVNAIGEALSLEPQAGANPSERLVRVGLKQGVPVYIVESDR